LGQRKGQKGFKGFRKERLGRNWWSEFWEETKGWWTGLAVWKKGVEHFPERLVRAFIWLILKISSLGHFKKGWKQLLQFQRENGPLLDYRLGYLGTRYIVVNVP